MLVRVTRLLAIAGGIVMLSVPTARAYTQSGTVAGTGTLGADVIPSPRPVGPNIILEGTTTGVLDGTFVATFNETFRDVVHSDGSVELTATLVFSGSTPCGTGTWRQQLVGQAKPDGTFSGQSTTIDQASSTVNMTTQFSFLGAGSALSYTGTYTCH